MVVGGGEVTQTCHWTVWFNRGATTCHYLFTSTSHTELCLPPAFWQTLCGFFRPPVCYSTCLAPIPKLLKGDVGIQYMHTVVYIKDQPKMKHQYCDSYYKTILKTCLLFDLKYAHKMSLNEKEQRTSKFNNKDQIKGYGKCSVHAKKQWESRWGSPLKTQGYNRWETKAMSSVRWHRLCPPAVADDPERESKAVIIACWIHYSMRKWQIVVFDALFLPKQSLTDGEQIPGRSFKNNMLMNWKREFLYARPLLVNCRLWAFQRCSAGEYVGGLNRHD